MTLAENIINYAQAGFAAIYVETSEPNEALDEIHKMCVSKNAKGEQRDWFLAIWDCDRGMQQGDKSSDMADPIAALKSMDGFPHGKRGFLVLKNFHLFFDTTDAPVLIQTIDRLVNVGKALKRHIIILSPVVKLPVEIEKLFVVVEHDLPTKEQILDVAKSIEGIAYPEKDEMNAVLEAASGMTRLEAANAMTLAWVKERKLNADTIWDMKAKNLKKSGLLEIFDSKDKFDSIGGLEDLKDFCLRSLQARDEKIKAKPRGVMLLGPPGTGKSAFAKALGAETGRKIINFDPGSLLGSLLGQSEQNLRRALKLIDSMEPCILFIDEVEKALAGGEGGDLDGGVKSGMVGKLLTWLNDHTSDIYTVCTANNIKILPAPFTRAGRFDAIYFVDLPGEKERKSIWNLYLKYFGIDTKQTMPNDTNWTGAEIKSCCSLASLLGVSLLKASSYVVPVSSTSAEVVTSLREWANDRCIDANKGGAYKYGKSAALKTSAKSNRSIELD